MTHRFLIAALLVSVLFNIGFVIGRTQSRQGGLTPEAKADTVDLVTRQLDLSPEQRSQFVELRRGFADDWEELQAEATLVRQELAEQFAAQEPDMDRIEEMLKQGMDVQRQIHQVASENFSEFAARLKPEQRERLGRMMGRHRPPTFNGHDPRRRMMTEFDANKDGVLDEQEKEKAHTFFRERGRRGEGPDQRRGPEGEPGRERWEGRGGAEDPRWSEERGERRFEPPRLGEEVIRSMLRRRFDANGDGIVDEIEAAALRDWLALSPERPAPPIDPGETLEADSEVGG